MNRISMILAAAIIVAAAAPNRLLAQEVGAKATAASREEAAREAAEAWLSLIAAEKYEQSWKEASSLFQAAMSAEAWARAAASVAGQTGALLSRRLSEARYTTQLPGAPAGEYVVLTYASSFGHAPNVQELVTMILEDGRWRVIGYFVRPAQ
jgi:hypothetical protein